MLPVYFVSTIFKLREFFPRFTAARKSGVKESLRITNEKEAKKKFTASIGRASLPGPCADDEGKKEEEGELIPLHTRTRLLTQTTDGGGRAYQNEKEEEEKMKKRADAESKRRGEKKNMADSRRA